MVYIKYVRLDRAWEPKNEYDYKKCVVIALLCRHDCLVCGQDTSGKPQTRQANPGRLMATPTVHHFAMLVRSRRLIFR